MVEHNLAKVGVAGSSPVVRSRIHSLAYAGFFSFIGPGIVRVEESLKKLQISKALFLLAFVGSQKGSSVEMQFNRTKFSPAFERKREVVGQKRRPRGAFSFPDKLLLHPNANVLGGFRQA